MAGAVSAVFSLHSLPTRSTTSICSRERVKFNKVSLLSRNVCSGAKAVSIIRAQNTTTSTPPAKTSKKNIEGLVIDKYTAPNPYIGKCINTIKITGDDAPAEIWHIVINTDGEIPYREGQSVGVIPNDEETRVKNFYSIASSARGDFGNSSTVSLCVKRSFKTDAQGQIVPGIASNFLCDLIPGQNVTLTGPVGRELLMPADPNANIIMLATGTGIATFRSFCWKMFFEQHDDYKFNGVAWLFFGVPTSSSLVYREEFRKMKETHPDKFNVDYAVGEGMNIPTQMNQHGEQLWELINKDNTFVYMSGNKDMEDGIDNFMTALAQKNGVIWLDYRTKLRREGRWNVEVY